jgi:hypothetical protein
MSNPKSQMADKARRDAGNATVTEVARSLPGSRFSTGNKDAKSLPPAAQFAAFRCSPEPGRPLPVLSIRERRVFLSQAVEMVAHGISPSLIVVGQPGLGKSHEITRTLQAMGMEEGHDYHIVKGYTSSRGLFETLFQNNGTLTILDDCDNALHDPVAVGLLKAALDSHHVRKISWVTANKGKDAFPKSFCYNGQVIFVSNRLLSDIDDAIHSRSLVIDYFMSREEILQHMEAILPLIKSKATPEQRQRGLDFVREWAPGIRQLNLRTLVSVLRIITAHPTNWKPLAIYTVTL